MNSFETGVHATGERQSGHSRTDHQHTAMVLSHDIHTKSIPHSTLRHHALIVPQTGSYNTHQRARLPPGQAHKTHFVYSSSSSCASPALFVAGGGPVSVAVDDVGSTSATFFLGSIPILATPSLSLPKRVQPSPSGWKKGGRTQINLSRW